MGEPPDGGRVREGNAHKPDLNLHPPIISTYKLYYCSLFATKLIIKIFNYCRNESMVNLTLI